MFIWFLITNWPKKKRKFEILVHLTFNERRDLSLLKSCFKALNDSEAWPDYLKLDIIIIITIIIIIIIIIIIDIDILKLKL